MQIKGLDKLRSKLPAYSAWRIVLLPMKGLAVCFLAYFCLIVLDALPRLFTGFPSLGILEPFIPLFSSFIVAGVSYNLIGKMWTMREEMQRKHGRLAYQKMISTGMIGVFLIPALMLHAVTPLGSLLAVDPQNALTVFLSESISKLVGVQSFFTQILRLSVALTFLILGILTVRSALLTFGIDYMTVLYLYFPEESAVQEEEIYSIIRHPTYFSMVLITLSCVILEFSIYSILIGMTVFLLIRLHIRREEEELIERFGDSYIKYMQDTPAIHIRPRDIQTFMIFLKGPK